MVEESTSALVTSEPYVVVDPEKADGLGSDAFYAWKVWMGCKPWVLLKEAHGSFRCQ